jgi:hypothetical protein
MRLKEKQQDVARAHVYKGLSDAIAEIDSDRATARCLSAERKLRLIRMSDDELWKVAAIIAPLLEKPVAQSYREIREVVEEHRQTATVWMRYLTEETTVAP